ncbi:sorting nexin-16 isoform X2 [Phodopus roborovskii]|uniref:sorting nexin-16 isoform X2 n=1 Tax=Phodopus roborovskii TaxID=109678 RepID=UPI0021E3B44C|nr:sorting nexin-16 isoform X2 [Phodopus roborovskii]
MATPYVPVPMPIGNSASSFTSNRNQRSSSFGSVSSSNSSKGQLEDSNMGADSAIEYSTRPRDTEDQHPDTVNWEERPSTPTILGYEVMEERAKFTVYKILVKKSPEESWVVFRRYTDFSRLNDKLKEMFPGFRLALPPKRWFKDNYNADFLEDRQLGLQAFLQNLVAHKDIANCLAVREFLCLDDPPGPFDSLEESRAFCETLEETNYHLQRELLEKQKEVESLKKLLGEKQLHIEALENRMRALSLDPEVSLYMPGAEGGQILRVESSALQVTRDILDEDSRANTKPHFHSREARSVVADVEVAQLAYNVEDD